MTGKPNDEEHFLTGHERLVAEMQAESRSWSEREYRETRERAEEALRNYAESMRFWNEPDDEHAMIQLRSLFEEVIAEVIPGG